MMALSQVCVEIHKLLFYSSKKEAFNKYTSLLGQYKRVIDFAIIKFLSFFKGLPFTKMLKYNY